MCVLTKEELKAKVLIKWDCQQRFQGRKEAGGVEW
jgi:hypothetical protein